MTPDEIEVSYEAYLAALSDPRVQAAKDRGLLEARKRPLNIPPEDRWRLNPDARKAFDEVFERVRADSATQDPMGRECAECDRLVDLVKDRYRAAGLAVQFLGEEQPRDVTPRLIGMPGWMGWWRTSPGEALPADVRAVRDLLECVRAAQSADHESGRVRAAKRVIALLREAQAACGEEPEPIAISSLTPSQRLITLVLLRADAVDSASAVKRGDIVQRVDFHQDTVRDCLKGLRDLGLVETTGERSWMSYYLNREGRQVGRYIVEHT